MQARDLACACVAALLLWGCADNPADGGGGAQPEQPAHADGGGAIAGAIKDAGTPPANGTLDAAVESPRPTDAGPSDATSDGSAGRDAGGRDAAGGDAGSNEASVPRDAAIADAGASPDSGGGSTSCQAIEPPSAERATIDLTWKEMTGGFEGKTGARPQSASILKFKNTLLDQVMENQGKLQYCVRYESTVPVSAELRDKIELAIGRGINEWFAKLAEYNCFPFRMIDVKVVGWAVRDRATLTWSDDKVPVYINDIFENAPQCAQACGRFFHQQPGYTYPNCPGGSANHYDKSLWLTEGFGNGGAGGDWGQRVDRAYFTGNVDQPHPHIFVHEIGHGLGFPDYYNWDAWVPAGTKVPNSIMVAGLSQQVTNWDGYMLRYTWDQLKSRWP